MRLLYDLVRELVDIPSVTGQEGELGRFLEPLLAGRGYRVALQEVEPERFNVFAVAGEAPRVVFCTHLDTVPPFFPSSEDEKAIHGRGTCDAKGILAAMIEAAGRLRASGVEGIGLLFVVGEELDSIGAKRANRLAPGSRFVVVGEPTENRMATGHKGGFKFRLRARGRAAHSAYPERGDSAIERLLDALAKIRSTDWGRSEILGPATVNVGTLSGGVAANVIAAQAEAAVFVRVVTKAEDIRRRLDGLLDGDSHLSYEVVAQNDPVFCETLPGFECAPVAFGTDIPSLTAFGKPLLLGPGSITVAHTDHERIEKAELDRAVELYCAIATELLKR
jgi:acetylornithine deacetylase